MQLDGDLQLIKVIVDPDSKTVNYQTTATGTIGNLFLAIGDAYLTDLDFSAYDHSLTKANVTNSWIPATSVTGVIGSGYYYGLINWGENNVLTDVEYHVKHMRPQLYKREYMEKIFAAAGYTWTSTYLDSAYYKSQLIPPTKEYLTLGTTAIANSQFYARRNATQTGALMNGGYSSELDDFILDHPQIKLWTHGHTHEDFDYQIGSCRILCNPRGYVNYEERADTWRLVTVEV